MTAPVVEWLETVSSTQDALTALAERGAPHGTAIAAIRQSAGRGSRGRAWAAEAGGLWLSVLVRPPHPESLPSLPLRLALAIAQAVEAAAPPCRLGVKWPNDLMLGGRKVGGVLCEARWSGAVAEWVAVGVGLNVENTPPDVPPPGATWLAAHATPPPAPALAPSVAAAIVAASAGMGPLTAAELAAWCERDWLRGRDLLAPAVGRARGVAADGALLVDTPGGAVLVREGTIRLADTD